MFGLRFGVLWSLNGVLGQIAKEYFDLAHTRNNLLHGTWFIGYVGAGNEQAQEFYIKQLAASKEGLRSASLPKTAEELKELTHRCDQTRNYIAALQDCISLVGDGSSIERRFKHNEKEWELRPYWKLPIAAKT